MLWARLVVLLSVLFHVGLTLAGTMSSSHQAVDIVTHDHDSVIAASYDYGHYQDELETDSDSNHKHNHNPLDHSHDKLNLPPVALRVVMTVPHIWNAAPRLPEYPPPYAAFERPPKTLSLL